MAGLNIDQLRLMLYTPLGIPLNSVQLPFTVADLYLNRAFWEVQNKFPFREKEVISNFNTTIGVRNYDVSFPTEAVKHISITHPNVGGSVTVNKSWPLEQITRDQYEQLYADNSDVYELPEKYVREGCIIRLWPTPDAIYTLTIERLVALTDISTSHVSPSIPQVWHEIIGLGGLWRLYLDKGDFARANATKQFQADLINTTIPAEINEAQSNSQLARVEVLGLDYEQNEHWDKRRIN